MTVSQETLKAFQDVRTAPHTGDLFRFLDMADSMEFIQTCKHHMIELCPVQEGDRVLGVDRASALCNKATTPWSLLQFL